jgi:hypothetical protein
LSASRFTVARKGSKMQVSELKIGDKVIFETVPSGSYLSENKLYQVENIYPSRRREVYFRSQSGSGTSEPSFRLSMKGVSFYRATC